MSKRIASDLKEIASQISSDIAVVKLGGNLDNMFQWQVRVNLPGDSVFGEHAFDSLIDLPQDYPFKAPSVKLTTPIFHPNVDEAGNVCLEILKEGWKPSLTMKSVVLALRSTLISPNCDQPTNAEAARLYKEDFEQYVLRAKSVYSQA